MRASYLSGWVLVLTVALGGSPTASAQKDKKPPAMADAKGVTRLEYSPDGSFVLMDYRTAFFTNPDRTDAILGVWDTKTGVFRRGFDKPPRTCERIAISPDGKKVAAISVSSKQLKVWDATNGKVLDDQKLPDWTGSIVHAPFLKFSPDGKLLNTVRDKQIMEIAVGGKFRYLGEKLDNWTPEEMAITPDAKRVVIVRNIMGRPEADLRVYDLTKDGAMETVKLTNHVRAMAVSGDGTTLALSYIPARGKSQTELWDATTWKLRTTALADARKGFDHYQTLAFSADGKVLAGAPLFDKVNTNLADLFDTDAKLTREVKKQSLKVRSMSFSPDGKTLAAILSNHGLAFIDPATGEEKKP